MALTIFVLVVALWGAWYALSHAGELERNIDSFDIVNSRLLVIEDFERGVFRFFVDDSIPKHQDLTSALSTRRLKLGRCFPIRIIWISNVNG